MYQHPSKHPRTKLRQLMANRITRCTILLHALGYDDGLVKFRTMQHSLNTAAMVSSLGNFPWRDFIAVEHYIRYGGMKARYAACKAILGNRTHTPDGTTIN